MPKQVQTNHKDSLFIKKPSTKTFLMVISISSFIMALSLVVTTYFLWQHLESIEKDGMISAAQFDYTDAKLQFCIDHTVSPCNDTQLKTWNEAHPEETFTFKDFQTLIEEGVRQYDVTHQ